MIQIIETFLVLKIDRVFMKILTISDYVAPALYDQLDVESFTGVNLILSCGDLPPEYLSFITRTFNVPLYYVRGNHDICYTTRPPHGCIDVDANLCPPRGSIYLITTRCY